MKPVINILLFFFFCTSVLVAQRTETITVKWNEVPNFITKSTYKFPGFTNARVYFKNGDISAGKFNYDYLHELMKYIDDHGDTLVIADETDVKYISAGLDTFYYDTRYYEGIASSSAARLASRTTLKLLRKDKIGAYGTSSPAVNVESHEAILDITNNRLAVTEVLVFSKVTTYYMSSMNGHFAQANKKNICKLFHNINIEEYINQHNFDLNKEADLRLIFQYASKSPIIL